MTAFLTMAFSNQIAAATLAAFLLGTPVVGGLASAAMDPQEVTAILAKSQVLDSRCKILTPEESEELKDLVARAEIALATKFSVSVARKSLASGRAAGRSAPCDAAAIAGVKEILKMGTQATRETTSNPETAATPPAAQTIVQKPAAVASATTTPDKTVPASPKETKVKAQRKMVLPEAAVAPVLAKSVNNVVSSDVNVRTRTKYKLETRTSLAGYADLAEKYYVELKCRNMPFGAAQRMYQNVLAQHKAAMSRDGSAAVRKMLRNAKSRAGAQSCG